MKKNERLFNSIGEIDDAFIKEAEPKLEKKKVRRGWIAVVAVAAVLSLVIAPVIYIVSGGIGIGRYSDSPYYSIIKKIDAYADKQKQNSSLLDYIGGYIGGAMSGDNVENMAPGDGAPGEIGSYEEITDNQTEGVIEADKIKRTDKFIYHLNGFVLSVYSIAGEDSVRLGSYNLKQNAVLNYNYDSMLHAELYLFAEDATVTVVISGTDSSYKKKLALISLDVSAPTNIKQSAYSLIDGEYISSRIADGKLLVITNYKVNYKNVDYDEPETFIPTVKSSSGITLVPAENIVSPSELTATKYTVVTALNTKTLEPEGSGAFLSYSDTVYVSENNVFATRSYNEQTQNGDITFNVLKTDISIMNYKDGLNVVATIPVKGRVEDRFSLDEYEGMLRVVTTVTETEYRSTVSNNGTSSADSFKSNTSASLYIYSMETLALIGSDEYFAPQGESVQSVRFNKEEVYVCTSIVFTDPVFFFDLSNPENITRKDTGTITGFSTSLIKFGDYLLGIGRESWSELKIEIYEETVDGVRSVDSYKRTYCTYPSEYKSYYINREESLLGIPLVDYGANYDQYVLLQIKGGNIVELARVNLSSATIESVRGVCIDGYLYVLSEGIHVVKI